MAKAERDRAIKRKRLGRDREKTDGQRERELWIRNGK